MLAVVGGGSCGGGGSSASSTSSVSGLEQLHEASCSYRVRCGIVVDMATCLGALDAYDGQVGAAAKAGRLTINAQALADCRATYESAACTTSGELSAANGPCWRALVGTVPKNGSCQLDVECASGACAVSPCGSACCNGTCGSADLSAWGTSTQGMQCFDSRECVPGLVCSAGSFGTHQCAQPSARGGGCDYSWPCDSFGDVCDDASKTCVAGTAIGGQCKSSFECVTGSSCQTGSTCSPQLGNGASSCAAPYDCLPGLTCTVGYCGPSPVCPY
jgi:hypothetical protein